MCSNIPTFKLKSFLSAWKNYWLVIFWLPKMLFFSLYKLNVRCRYKIWKLFITIAKLTFSLIEGISLLMYLCQIQKNYFIDKKLIGMFCHFAYLWSVQFSSSVMSDSLRPHGLQPGLPVHHQLLEFTQTHVHWVGDAIQPPHPLSSLSPPSIFPSIRVFSNDQFFASSGQSIGVSASASVLPMNIQDWFPLGWTCLILQSKGLSRVFFNTTVQKHEFFSTQLSL